jgi:hypothetical protein
VPTSSLRVGDVIVFFPPGYTTPEMHRIASISRVMAGPANAKSVVTTMKTAGDANHKRLDSWGPVAITSTSAYRLETLLPKLGWIPVWTGQIPGKTGRAILLITAGLLFGLATIKWTLSGTPGTETADLTDQPVNTQKTE